MIANNIKHIISNSLVVVAISAFLFTLMPIEPVSGSPILYPRNGVTVDNNSTVAISGIGSGSSWGLNAPNTRYRVMTTDSTPTITIEYACEGNNHGNWDLDDADYEHTGGVSQTYWRMYRTDPNTNRAITSNQIALVSSAQERVSGTVCSQTLRPKANNVSASSRSNIEGFRNFYVFEIRVQECCHTAADNGPATDGSGKGFRVRVNTGYVTPIDIYTYQPARVLKSSNASATQPASSLGTALLGRLRGSYASDSSVKTVNGEPATDYSFTFSPDCRIQMPANGNGVSVYLFWYDMDIGVSGSETGRESLRILEDGTPINLTARRPGNTTTYGSGSTLEGTELNGGATGSARWAAAEFRVKRDATYTVEFNNVHYSSNALEVYLPFPDYGGSFTCPDPVNNISAIADCDVIGYYFYPLNRSEKYTVNFQYRLRNTDGSWATGWSGIYTDLANRTGSEYNFGGHNGSGNGFRRAPASNRISATQNTYVRAWVNYQNEPADYLTSTAGTNLGRCDQWFDLSSSAVASSSISAPGESVTITFVVCNDDDERNMIPPAARGTAPSVNVRTISSQVPGTQTLSLNSSVNTTRNFTASGSNNCVSITRTGTIPASSQVGTEYCTTLRTNKNYGNSSNTGLGGHPLDASACVKVSNGPYLQAWGNDIWSGGNWDLGDASGCNAPPGSGQIVSNTRGAFGALVEYAAYAWGEISSFGSSGNADEHTLKFANDSTPHGFLGTQRCLSELFDNGGGSGGEIHNELWDNADGILSDPNDFDKDITGQFTIGNNTGIDTSTYTINNNKIGGSGAGNVFTGNATILVNGNLHLQNNIVNDNTGWSAGNVPMFIVIVTGNIYINPGVTQLDGIFISKRTIDTCTVGANDTFNENLAVGGSCDEHLEVNGTFIANNIAFRRVFGGTNEAATGNNLSRCRASGGFYDSPNRRCAAETFRYNPSLYLAEPILNYGDTFGPNNFPIQQLRDLPPIY